ncbi:hypothetical protein AK812_SmicGene16051 [Symbiodinium microadriaticum]|uniref:Uncharacterized protein n=1 Tax=Symbiodinium microadriaticum TaxID=2951 RepID=A0A1Q9E1D5_SYMMI|nr:hypothetical protein AK812_SmicGene16051 [Symbiodinium microadriaticum]
MMSLPAAKPEKAVDEDDDDWEDEAEEEPEARPPLKRRRKKVSKVNGQRDAALDAMLDEPLEFVDRPSTGSGASQAETRLQQLRSKLQGKKVEVKSSTTPAAVLASRASATAEKSKQRKPKGNKVLKALGRALSIKSRGSKDKDDDSDDDSECDGLDDDEDDDLARGSWQVKRQRLRKIAEEKPGQLLAQTLASLHEQLETTTGEEAKDPLAPIMVRYLLSMVVPRYNQLQGTDRYRELRTLCQSLDLLLKGKVDSAADVLIQRVKSLLMSVRDGSDQFGRYLELIPEEALGVSFEESVFARELAVKQANLSPQREPHVLGPKGKSDPQSHSENVVLGKESEESRRKPLSGRPPILRKSLEDGRKAEPRHVTFEEDLDKQAQQQALDNITGLVERFVQNPFETRDGKSFEQLVQSKGLDYAGEEIMHALPLRLEEVLPGLPAEGDAGSLDAATVAVGEVLDWLLDPMQCLLPRDQWPDPIPKARMNSTREEWHKVAQVLVEKGILVPIQKEDIFHVGGVPLLNGIFTVEKKGAPAPGQTRVTRLIMNCVPTNSIQRLMVGDLPTLSGSSQWASAFLRPSQVLLWSGDDQKGVYYAWKLPAAWRPFMTFMWPVPGSLVGCPDVRETYAASGVIPMGWINAVSLFQHLHRRLGFAAPPAGAGLDPSAEWRRDRATPRSATELSGGWVQFYLDDFDAPEFVEKTEWKRLQGVLSQTHKRQRAAYARQGVGISPDKAHVREPIVNRMGACVDGVRGFVSAPSQKILETGWMCVWLLSQRKVGQKPLLMVLGRLAEVILVFLGTSLGVDERGPGSPLRRHLSPQFVGGKKMIIRLSGEGQTFVWI